jgi:hypothetical protein
MLDLVLKRPPKSHKDGSQGEIIEPFLKQKSRSI